MEAMVSVRAAYGTIVEELKDVSRSYKEADMALEVGRVFYTEKKILAYNESRNRTADPSASGITLRDVPE